MTIETEDVSTVQSKEKDKDAKEGESTTVRRRSNFTVGMVDTAFTGRANSSNPEQHGYTTALPTEGKMASRRRSRDEQHLDIKKLKSNISGATSVRKHLKVEDDDLHLQNKFNKKEFFTSMIYETLPPVFGSPLLALALEGPTQAYHFMNHRLFLPVDKSYQKTNGGAIIYIWWIVMIPIFMVIHCGLWGGIFFSEQVRVRSGEDSSLVGVLT